MKEAIPRLLKAFAPAVTALVLLLILAGGIVLAARSLPIPVSYIERQDCQARAKAEHNSRAYCPKTETVWDRGLSDPVAFYTLWLTLFTLALAIGAAFQSVLIGRQISLARDEFNTSHRPRIRVRAISFPSIPQNVALPTTFKITIVNAGDNDCWVQSAIITAVSHDGQDGFVIGLDPLSEQFPIHLVSGDRHVFRCRSTGNSHAWAPIEADAFTLIVSGEIKYTDKMGITRHTGFARDLDGRKGTFGPSRIYADEEYED